MLQSGNAHSTFHIHHLVPGTVACETISNLQNRKQWKQEAQWVGPGQTGLDLYWTTGQYISSSFSSRPSVVLPFAIARSFTELNLRQKNYNHTWISGTLNGSNWREPWPNPGRGLWRQQEHPKFPLAPPTLCSNIPIHTTCHLSLWVAAVFPVIFLMTSRLDHNLSLPQADLCALCYTWHLLISVP